MPLLFFESQERGSDPLSRLGHLVEPADLRHGDGAVPGEGVQQRGLLGVQRVQECHAELRAGPAAG